MSTNEVLICAGRFPAHVKGEPIVSSSYSPQLKKSHRVTHTYCKRCGKWDVEKFEDMPNK